MLSTTRWPGFEVTRLVPVDRDEVTFVVRRLADGEVRSHTIPGPIAQAGWGLLLETVDMLVQSFPLTRGDWLDKRVAAQAWAR